MCSGPCPLPIIFTGKIQKPAPQKVGGVVFGRAGGGLIFFKLGGALARWAGR